MLSCIVFSMNLYQPKTSLVRKLFQSTFEGLTLPKIKLIYSPVEGSGRPKNVGKGGGSKNVDAKEQTRVMDACFPKCFCNIS